MKRITILVITLCLCTFVSAAKRVDTMDDNKWNWLEWADQYSSLSFEDGYMVLNYKKAPKLSKEESQKRKQIVKFYLKHNAEIQKYLQEGNNEAIENLYKEYGLGDIVQNGGLLLNRYKVRTFTQLPIQSDNNYKVTIKYIQPVSSYPQYAILFNANKNCLNDFDDEYGACQTDGISINSTGYSITYTTSKGPKIKTDKFPLKLEKESLVTLTIEKKLNKIVIELNGIELLKDDCTLSEPCLGFELYSAGLILKIDEIEIEQAESEDD